MRENNEGIELRAMEGVKQTKVKYTHSGNTLKSPFEY
jgi:hypothetical protein